LIRIIIQKSDNKAKWLIWIFSVTIFLAVTALERVTLNVNLGFNPHVFALINAVINSIVAILLVAGLLAAKQRRFERHKTIMLSAISLSLVFLISYILHHLFAGSTLYGDTNHDLVVDSAEKAAAGASRYVYLFLLGTHILMAGISLPFILFSAYRALIEENDRHRKIARITWPMWFYVAITGPVVYLMISRYY
jgi:putative membrane protein